MTGPRRTAFSRLDALVVVVGLGLALALAVPFVLRARLHAKREQSADNLKRLVLAMYDYIDNHDGWLPPGCDDKHFSVVAKVLPYLGQQDLHKRIDYSKRITDPVNQAARRTRLDVVLSPLDDQPAIGKDPTKTFAPTSYLFNGIAFPFRHPSRLPSSFENGTSETVFVVETLRGDGSARAVDVRRQHIVLSQKDADRYRKELRVQIGLAEFDANLNVAADRCSSWMDGRMLQGTFLPGLRPGERKERVDDWAWGAARVLNDPRPDVVILTPYSLDGFAAPRSLTSTINVGMGDGTVRHLDANRISPGIWYKDLECSAPYVRTHDW